MDELVRSPSRRRVCLGCRTLLADGETCGAARGHEAVKLEDLRQRARLDDEVWGPDSRARQLRRAAKAGAGGGVFGGAMQGCGALDGLNALEGCGELASAGEGIAGILIGLLFVVLAAIVTALLVWTVGLLIGLIRERLDRPKPHGALRAPPKAHGRSNGPGTVHGSARVALPWKNAESVAYALELHAKQVFGGGALLRDAMTAGFDVTLDDGRRVRIPPGRVSLLGKLGEEEIERERVDAFLADVDPHAGSRPLFPYQVARGLALNDGDRVEVLGELETSADGSQGHAYRASAGLLVPVGVPVLRVRRRADDDAHYRIAGGGGTGDRTRVAADATATATEEDATESKGEARDAR